MSEPKVFTYFEKNVPYFVGVKMNARDHIGHLLTGETPFIAIEHDELRDFRIANKRLIVEGIIKIVDEPNLDWDTPNTISDAQISEYLKSFLKLKSKMADITSLPIAQKFLAAAKAENKSPKIIELITNRIDEIAMLIEDPSLMRGVELDT